MKKRNGFQTKGQDIGPGYRKECATVEAAEDDEPTEIDLSTLRESWRRRVASTSCRR